MGILDQFNFGGSGRAGGVGTLGVGGGFAPPTTDTTGGFNFGDFFKKDGGAGLALGGLATLGSFFDSFQQLKLAKDTLKFQKGAFRENLRNSKQVFNGTLTDKLTSRGVTEGKSQAETDALIAERRLA
jgi:hypothetical protein